MNTIPDNLTLGQLLHVVCLEQQEGTLDYNQGPVLWINNGPSEAVEQWDLEQRHRKQPKKGRRHA